MFIGAVGDLLARVSNINMSDVEAEQQIEETIVRASVEIRERARQARASEKNNYESNRQHEKIQAEEALKHQPQRERDLATGRERNQILAIAENYPGLPRR